MSLHRIFFLAYLGLRGAEAVEVGITSFQFTTNLVVTAVYVFLFLFALALVVAGVTHVGDWASRFWHCTLEALLVPVSIQFAYQASIESPQFGGLSSWDRFCALCGVFLVAQALLAIAGFHVVTWAASAQRRASFRTKAATSRPTK
jgi:predicted cation transporter